MVKRKFLLAMTVAAAILALFLPALLPRVMAQGWQEEQSFTLDEETRIKIDEVGDAHITDTVAYDSAWFDEYGYIFEENPNLLSRRYRSDSNVGEVENFDADIDRRMSTVTISFDTPGYAYNMGEGWEIYGYKNYELVSKTREKVELEASWVLTNEFTLFESMPLQETVIFELPPGVTDSGFDKGTGTVSFQLPYVEEKKGGLLAQNKTPFTIIFALLMALSLLLFLFAVTRKAAVPVPAAIPPLGMPGPTAGAPPTTPFPAAAQPAVPPEAGAGAPPTPPEPPVAEPLQPPVTSEGTAPETQPPPRFCKRCGQPRSDLHTKFCKNCGAPFEQ